jgi:hypothetical protein
VPSGRRVNPLEPPILRYVVQSGGAWLLLASLAQKEVALMMRRIISVLAVMALMAAMVVAAAAPAFAEPGGSSPNSATPTRFCDSSVDFCQHSVGTPSGNRNTSQHRKNTGFEPEDGAEVRHTTSPASDPSPTQVANNTVDTPSQNQNQNVHLHLNPDQNP